MQNLTIDFEPVNCKGYDTAAMHSQTKRGRNSCHRLDKELRKVSKQLRSKRQARRASFVETVRTVERKRDMFPDYEY